MFVLFPFLWFVMLIKKWEEERWLWIGWEKNVKKSLISKLPKIVVQRIVSFL